MPPLSFSLLIPNFASICNTEHQYASADQSCRAYCNSVKWIDDNNDQIVDVLRDNLMSLDSCLNSTFNSQENVDTAVNSFSTTLRDLVLPYCKVCTLILLCYFVVYCTVVSRKVHLR